MRGVAVDALNPTGRPKPDDLGLLDSVRIEMRDDPLFYEYVKTLEFAGTQLAYLYGPSTTNMGKILRVAPRPNMLILLNEPDGSGPSSWAMSKGRAKRAWNQAARVAQKYATGVPLCFGGLVNGPEYLEDIWDQLDPRPDMVNKHYPANSSEIVAMRYFGLPVVIGEHCCYGCSQEDMDKDVADLQRYSDHDFWFCWSNGMVPNMGLTATNGRKLVYYGRYQNALNSGSVPANSRRATRVRSKPN